MTLTLPNLRRMLIPDPGFTICEIDMKGADARVVAWEADDEPLKTAFRRGWPIHAFNAKTLWPVPLAGVPLDEVEKRFYPLYHRAKTAVHAVNYGCKARTLAEHIGTNQREAERFIQEWFSIHPGIREWHRGVEARLRQNRRITNKFGYGRPYFDRVEALLPKALAWLGQSTTACAVNRALVNVNENLPQIHILLQTHDSLTVQIPTNEVDDLMPSLIRECTIIVPYPDPLEMQVSVKISDCSWGEVETYHGLQLAGGVS